MYHICIDGIRIWDTYMDIYVYGIHVWIHIYVILKTGDIYGKYMNKKRWIYGYIHMYVILTYVSYRYM